MAPPTDENTSPGPQNGVSTFSMTAMAAELENITPSKTFGSARKAPGTDPKLKALGTVTFYNAISNCRSPAMPLYSPSHKEAPIVETETGEHVKYREWMENIRSQDQRTPSGMSSMMRQFGGIQVKNTAQTLDFSGNGNGSPSAPPPPRTGPKCSLLQEYVEDLTAERHKKLLVINATVSEITLKRAIQKLDCQDPLEDLNRRELIEKYLEVLRA